MRIWGMFAMGVALVVLAASEPRAGVNDRVTPKIAAPSEAHTLSRAFADTARAIGPSVVRVEVTAANESATASGVVIDTRGNVVTSDHVLDGARATGITVVLVDGRRFRAELLGRDADSDVAVLRMDAPPPDLTAARFGDSDAAEVGEWVLAVGSPLGLEQTFTVGIISGRAHLGGDGTLPLHSYLQTDAKVNPGNSGGPLVNLDGEVLGLSALISAGPGGSYGYAVPINRARRMAEMLIRDGRVHRPYLGIAVRDVRGLDSVERRRWSVVSPFGALVSRIWHDAPAARAGLRQGDVIVSINDREIPASVDLVDYVSVQEVGAKLRVGFVRGGAIRTLPLAVEELPSLAAADRAERSENVANGE
jgi:S1-C subfamily serine protease